jgi:hypothetical protein
MRANRPRTVTSLLLMLAVVSCGDGTVEPDKQAASTTWALSLVNQKTSAYGGSSCVGTMSLHCMTWHEDPRTFAATLTQSDSAWTLTIGQTSWRGNGAPGDYPVKVWLRNSPYCDGYHLEFRPLADSLWGDFVYHSDCHGAGNYGTLTGHR